MPLLFLLYCPLQAFINTAKEIYQKIQDGVIDITNEVSKQCDLFLHSYELVLCNTIDTTIVSIPDLVLQRKPGYHQYRVYLIKRTQHNKIVSKWYLTK